MGGTTVTMSMKKYEDMKGQIAALKRVSINNFISRKYKNHVDMASDTFTIKYDTEAIEKFFRE